MVERRNVARDSVLLELAADLAERLPGLLSLQRFEADFHGRDAMALLEEDIKEVRFRQIGRFPALVLRRPDSTVRTLVGWRPYAALHREVAGLAPALGPERRAASRDHYRAYWRSISERELDIQEDSLDAGPEQAV